MRVSIVLAAWVLLNVVDNVYGNFGAIFAANNEANRKASGQGGIYAKDGERARNTDERTFSAGDDDVKLFEGDIVYTKEVEREVNGGDALFDAATRKKHWNRHSIPYAIERGHERILAKPIAAAVAEYNRQLNGCIKWTKYSSRQAIRARKIKNYIIFFVGQGCYSMIGQIGGEQKISLGTGCYPRGTVMHEMMHALGFYHEQSRRDRDKYITIYTQNIIGGMAFNFKKYNAGKASTLGEPYDIQSIMHYPPKAFSKNGRVTIVSKKGVTKFGWNQQLSTIDVRQLRKYYKCSGGGTRPSSRVNGGWGAWSLYSACNKKCGGGKKVKVRRCNNPTPKNGGSDCKGSKNYYAKCNEQSCSGGTTGASGGWSRWSKYSKCSKRCGGGRKRKTRKCKRKKCKGSSTHTVKCNTKKCSSTATLIGRDCRDQKQFCRSWSQMGYCVRNSKYYPFMQTSCRRACRFCR